MRRAELDAFIAASTTAHLSHSDTPAGQAERMSTSQALAELRSQLDAAGARTTLHGLRSVSPSIAESAQTLAERLKGFSSLNGG